MKIFFSHCWLFLIHHQYILLPFIHRFYSGIFFCFVVIINLWRWHYNNTARTNTFIFFFFFLIFDYINTIDPCSSLSSWWWSLFWWPTTWSLWFEIKPKDYKRHSLQTTTTTTIVDQNIAEFFSFFKLIIKNQWAF